MKNNIKKIRESRNISKDDLALRLRISKTHLTKVENGERKCPISLAVRIAEVLDCSLDEIFLS